MNTSDLGKQVISKTAEVGIKNQLDKVEALDVEVHTEPLDLVQGKIDAVSIKGKGLVMKQQLRAEKIRIETSSIDIDPLKAAVGEIELNEATAARTLIVLKEEDIQKAFNCNYVREKLQKIKIEYQGQKAATDIKDVRFSIPEVDKIHIVADVALVGTDCQESIAFTALPRVNREGNNIEIEDISYEGENSQEEFTAALIESVRDLLDLRNLDLKGISLNIRKLKVEPGKIKIEADTTIEDFPS